MNQQTIKLMSKNTTEHTPGPWRTNGSSPETGWPNVVLAETTGIVADCGATHKNCRPYAEQCANANLIASAPELLSALEESYKALEKSVQFETGLPFWRKGGAGYAAMLSAREALNHAKGTP